LHQRRQIVAGLESQKQAMVAALWSNSAYDDGKDTRNKVIREIEESYAGALKAVDLGMGFGVVPEEEKLDKDNPFFAAAERGLQKVDKYIASAKGGKAPEKPKEDDYTAIDQA
jgi:hypothetical protein